MPASSRRSRPRRQGAGRTTRPSGPQADPPTGATPSADPAAAQPAPVQSATSLPVGQPREPRTAVLFSGHTLRSARRANFHFLAEALHRQGWRVVFVTVQISPLSRMRGDPRCEEPDLAARRNRLEEVEPGLWGYVWWTPYHVVHLRSGLLDAVTSPLATLWARLPMPGLEPVLRRADLLMVESTGALLLVDRIRRLNPTARLVYRVSDDLRALGQHAAILAAEQRFASRFDLISVPARSALKRFARPIEQGLDTVRLHPHGIDAAAFDAPHPNPYAGGEGEANLVAVGHSFHDPDMVPAAAALFPHWTFHVIGRVPKSSDRGNIRWYGEIPFAQTIPFLVHADIGLAPYRQHPGAEGLADSSLKLMQYTWCRLPAVAPEFCARADRPHVLTYRPGDRDGLRRALLAAHAYDRTTISRAGIRSWDRLARAIANPGDELAPDTVVPFKESP